MKKLLLTCGSSLLISACAHQQPAKDLPPSPVQITHADENFNLPSNGKLSLSDAVLRSLKRNRDLAVQELEPAIVSTDELREQSEFGSEIYADIEYGEEVSSESSRSTEEIFSVEAETRASELGLSKNFTSGTEVALVLSESNETSNRAPAQQELRAGIALSQSLLRGRGSQVNRIAIRQAELGTQISIEELRAYTQALIAETEIAYWQLQLAGEAVEITRQALEVADQQLSEIQQRIEIGQLAPDEEFAARAERSSRQRDVIDARANYAERKLSLERLLSLQDGDGENLELISPLELAEEPITELSTLWEQADRLNPRLREARARLHQNELEVVKTRNGLLPDLEFFANLDKTGYGEDTDSARKDFSGDNYEWNVGLQFQQDLGDSEAKADQLQADLEREQAERAVANLEELIQNQLNQAVVEHNRTLEQSIVSKQTLRFRQQTAEAEKARFEVGTSTSLLVAQAQREALESQIDELENRIQYRNALVRLEELTGNLLLRYGVDVQR
ncbi:TolC family protein [Kiritimatiellaeota bacterium B1221]|nr:TolC family protein [Kiritimatiellaeota bacterium B1221]